MYNTHKKHIGILGAGQLSRMLALSGIPLGFEFSFFESAPEHCVQSLGSLTQAPYTDLKAIERFIESCDVITFENENIPVDTAQYIAKRKPIYPNPEALATTQDRWLEKSLFTELDIKTVAYANIHTREDIYNFINTHSLPAVLKTRRMGYDGKGQYKLNTVDDIESIPAEKLQNTIIEQYIKFDREVSMIAVRSVSGQTQFYDICENEHHKGVLFCTKNRIQDPIFPTAQIAMTKILDKFKYVGCIAFEFFQVGNELYANELAPRVHNSGHWTLEGAYTSQFENHLRAILDLPLGNTQSVELYQMFNLLGAIPDPLSLLSYPQLKLHDYQKSPRAGRKVGHINCPAQSIPLESLYKLLGR